MYGDQDYYPGDDYRDGQDATYHAEAPEQRNPHVLVGRNANFAAGAVRSRLTSARSALALNEKEAFDQRAGAAANLAADRMIHERAQKG